MAADIEKIISQVTEAVLKQMAAENTKYTMPMSAAEVASRFEHSMLNPDFTWDKMLAACEEAKKYRYGVLCATPYLVPRVKQELGNSGVKICTVAGFPHGAASTVSKVAEIKEAAENGADEIDVAINMVAIKSGLIDEARRDLDALVNAAHGRIMMKAIFEHGLYTPEEKEIALSLIKRSGVRFVKISNALSGKKACVEDVKFVRERVGLGVKIKIDGGVKTLDTALALFNAGADRIGLTATKAICEEAAKR